ncbi:MAG: TIGR02611 family protein [Micromonosporaceae bacterium]
MRDDLRITPATAVVDRPAAPSESRDPGTVIPRIGLLDRIRATSAGRITLKVVVAVFGVATVLLGLVMIPLPGPGWLVVFAGLAILSVEYVWAKHLLHFSREKIRGWTHWIGRQSWLVRGVIGTVGLLVVAVLVWVAVRNGFGIDLVEQAWRFMTSH